MPTPAEDLRNRLKDPELQNALMDFVSARTNNRADVDELVQETLLGIYAGERVWDGVVTFKTFAEGVLRSKLSHRRRKARNQAGPSFDEEQHEAPVPDSGRDVEKLVTRKQEHQSITAWIDDLRAATPPNDRISGRILTIFIEEEVYLPEEQALRLNVSRAAVVRARKRIRYRARRMPPPQGVSLQTVALVRAWAPDAEDADDETHDEPDDDVEEALP